MLEVSVEHKRVYTICLRRLRVMKNTIYNDKKKKKKKGGEKENYTTRV
jgi:hypothetical protein